MPVSRRCCSPLMIAAFARPGRATEGMRDRRGPAEQVARAMLDFRSQQSAGKPEDAAAEAQGRRQAAERRRHDEEPESAASFVLGQTLVFWLGAAGHGERHHDARRARFRDRTRRRRIDLIAGIDSAFSIVETANPECDRRRRLRGVSRRRGSISSISAIDARERRQDRIRLCTLAQAARCCSRGPRRTATWCWRSGGRGKDKAKEAIDNYKLAIAAAKDTRPRPTTAADVRVTIWHSYAADLADQATGAEKTAYAARGEGGVRSAWRRIRAPSTPTPRAAAGASRQP